jgi:two-component system LytT family sensor kinase
VKKSNIIPHLVFWALAYLFWIFIFRNNTLVLTHAITIQFCYLVFIAANYYFNTGYAIPRLLNNKKYVAFALCLLAGITITAALRVPVSILVNIYIFNVANFHPNLLPLFRDSFVNILFWVVIILTAKFVADKVRSTIYIEQIEKEKAEHELDFLRAQFNPHFLFNSINSIYAHIDKSNKTARNMLLVFSEMLRYQLYECNVDKIELGREVNYIKNYIEMQKSRMDDRIMVNFCACNTGENIKLAPLLLVIFIENAFKYVGFNEGKENRVDISLKYEDGNLHFRSFNSKDSYLNPAEKSSGLGIANARRRLELLYPGKHSLQIENHDESFEINLTLRSI